MSASPQKTASGPWTIEDVCSNNDPAETFLRVQVRYPNLTDRKEIFEHFLNAVEVASDVNAHTIASRTPGFTGNNERSGTNYNYDVQF